MTLSVQTELLQLLFRKRVIVGIVVVVLMIERDTGIEPVLRVENGAIHSQKNLAPNLPN